MNYLIVECPHCKSYIYILKKEINCKIFRHGVDKSNNKQIKISKAYTLTEDMDTDFKHFHAFFSDVKGKNPEQF